jgi:hypothetical protein
MMMMNLLVVASAATVPAAIPPPSPGPQSITFPRAQQHQALHWPAAPHGERLLNDRPNGRSVDLLPHLLTIDWRRLPDLAPGFQNSDGGWISADEVVCAFGHGAGAFLNATSLLNVTAAAATSCRGGGAGRDAGLLIQGVLTFSTTTLSAAVLNMGHPLQEQDWERKGSRGSHRTPSRPAEDPLDPLRIGRPTGHAPWKPRPR